jgi:hypothetical protein
MKVLRQLAGWEKSQNRQAKELFPALLQSVAGDRGQDVPIDVKQLALLRILKISHSTLLR